jgi:ABC-type nickel/cobalt efflux system permease component RcnA
MQPSKHSGIQTIQSIIILFCGVWMLVSAIQDNNSGSHESAAVTQIKQTSKTAETVNYWR